MFSPAPFRRPPARLTPRQFVRTVRRRPVPQPPRPQPSSRDARADDGPFLTNRELEDEKTYPILKKLFKFDEKSSKPTDVSQADPRVKAALEKGFGPSGVDPEERERLEYERLKDRKPSDWEKNPDLKVNFYEQYVHEVGRRAPRKMRDPTIGSNMTYAEVCEKEKEVWAKFWKNEEEIEKIENDDLDAIARAIDPEIKWLSDADPKEVKKELAALVIRVEGVDNSPELNRLNEVMRAAFLATDKKLRPTIKIELWKAYKRAKRTVPGLLDAMPNPAWDILWYTQMKKYKATENRERRMKEIKEDLDSVGWDGPPTPREELGVSDPAKKQARADAFIKAAERVANLTEKGYQF